MSGNTPPPSAVTAEDDGKDKTLAEKRKLQRQQDDEDLRWVMSTPAGRRFVRKQLERCGIFRMSFAGEQTHATALNEGKRSIGNQLFADIEAVAADAFIELLRESHRTKKAR